MNGHSVRALCLLVLARAAWALDFKITLDVAPKSYNQTGCGFFTMRATIRCTGPAGAYLAYAEECRPGTGSCEAAPEYLYLACADQLECSLELLGGNSKPLCLAVTNGAAASISCDVFISGEIGPDSGNDTLKWPTWKIVAVAVGAGLGVALTFLMIFVLGWCICGTDKNGPRVAPAPHPMDMGTIPYNPGVYPQQYAGMAGGRTNPADKIAADYGPKSNAGAHAFNGPMVLNMHGFPVPYLSPQIQRLPA